MKNYLFVFTLFIGLTSYGQSFQVPVYTVTSLQNAEPEQETMNAIDGNVNTMYHSQWYTNGIPDKLDFYFSASIPPINKIVYTPRQLGGTNGMWTKVSVSYSTQDDNENFTTLFEELNWDVNTDDKNINLMTPISNVAVIRFDVLEGIENFSSCAEMTFYSQDEYENPYSECSVSTANLSVTGANDIKAQIQTNGSSASAYQPGENIEKSFDGNVNTIYHSPWSNTQFPITLNYRLNGTTTIDYLKYTPRQDGSPNGHFGNVTIKYNTTGNSTFQELMTYNFNQSNMPRIVAFPESITPLTIQIIVHDGKNNFASCAEMEFFKYGDAENNGIPTNIFADDLCSELLPTVNQSTINGISSPFFKQLAQCLYDGTYRLNYRLQEYEVYKPYGQLEQELKTWTYNKHENPTGIAFEEGEKVAIFVGDIPDVLDVYLHIRNHEEGYYGTDSYNLLKTGLNVFEVGNTGLGYINYFNSDETLPNIPIHIVSGNVNGYFNLNTSNESEWMDLLENTNYPKIDLVGDFTHLVFNKYALKQGSPFEGKSLIQKYDTIVRWEWEMMGLFKYDIVPKNRMNAFIEAGNGYYAHVSGIHLDETWGIHNVTNADKLDLWGIPHEFGHINQMAPDLNWVGTGEVTNNVFSVWVNYKMNHEGNKYTRLESSTDPFLPNFPSVVGGTINGQINSSFVHERPLQDGIENIGYDVFHVLVPFWQLELYYQEAGACRNAPELLFDYPTNYTGVDYAHWYGYVCEMARNAVHSNWTHGEMVMNFVKYTCDAVQEDLTDFFVNTGFLRPIDKEIDDYGVAHLLITQEMIDETKQYIQNQGYETPVSPVINYLSAHSVNAFKNQLPLQGENGVGVTLQGNKLLIENDEWENAVAFETYTEDDELLHVAIIGTDDISLETTTIYYPENAKEVWAVGYDGVKILVYPIQPITTSLDKINVLELLVYPNPSFKNDEIRIQGKSGWYQVEIVNVLGENILNTKGKLFEIESAVNNALKTVDSGVYTLILKNGMGKEKRMKLMRL